MININKCKNTIKNIIIKIKEDNISEYSAEAAYFTILSFIPFTFFFFALMKFTDIDKNTITIILNELIPSNINSIILNVIEEIYSKSISTISFSAIIIIWSAGKGFFSLSKGIRNIYKVNIKNNFILRITGCIYTLILIIVILLFLIILLIGKSIYVNIMTNWHEISIIIHFLYKFRIVFLIIFMTIFFGFLYKFVSKKRGKNFTHLYGALFSAVGWQILSYFISIYMEISKNFSFLYGSLSSVILIMLWIYFCMYIILIGAEINVFINDRETNIKRR